MFWRRNWLVCGSFFLMGREIGFHICQRLKQIAIETTNLGWGHGDEMLFLEVLEEFGPDQLVRSYGDYNQILNNLVLPTKNIPYVVHMIFKPYLDYGYYQECIDGCLKVLDAYDRFLIDMDDNLYATTVAVCDEACRRYLDLLQDQLGEKTFCKKKLQTYLNVRQIKTDLSNKCRILDNGKTTPDVVI